MVPIMTLKISFYRYIRLYRYIYFPLLLMFIYVEYSEETRKEMRLGLVMVVVMVVVKTTPG